MLLQGGGIEYQYNFNIPSDTPLNHPFLQVSGIRMFKLSMCCALFSMMFLLRRSRIRFNRDWFMRLCGLMLDLLFIAALSKAYPKPKNLEETHYAICGLFVLVW